MITPLIDTHAHIQAKDYAGDLAIVLARAGDVGVETVIAPGSDVEDSRMGIAIANMFPGVYAAVGVHPHEAKSLREEDLDELEALARCDRVVAMGEMGLDYHYDFSPPDAQRTALRLQLRLARRVGKPLILHSRLAQGDLLQILREERAGELGGVLHCYSGSWDEAQPFLAMGFHLGFTGVVTFKKSHALREIARMAPLERILSETDCPYLAPMPFRGKRNEPAYIPYIVEELARARALEVGEMSEALLANARRCFPALPQTP